MRVHHRIPSIFNLSMVDVLCCALGCVILLWLLNLRDAKEHEDEARASADKNAELLELAASDKKTADSKLTALRQELSEVTKDRDRIQAQVSALTDSAKELSDRLAAANARLSTMSRAAQESSTRTKALQAVADTVPELQTELKEAKERYAAELKEAREKSANEEALATALEKDLAKKIRELTDTTKTLQVMQAAKQALERELGTKSKDLEVATSYKDRWTSSANRVAELEKLAEERGKAAMNAKQSVELLEEEKKALRAEASRYRQSADNRFAGIQLTGKRVVFLVDMSGSMELVDENTPAPQKWQEVRQTLVKVMRSLPDLEKFQVVIFSEKATFLIGGEDRWIDYDAKTTPDQILTALAAVKPKGGTNMYSAFDVAFSFRARGLDTIYLFSDGLPNLGEGITAEQARTLKEVDQSEILGKYIRKKLRSDWNAPGERGARVRINAVGFFFESPDVGAFLWALARENDGSFVGMSKP
jgi:hypothetical protein